MPDIRGLFNVYTWGYGDCFGAFTPKVINNNATNSGSQYDRTFTNIIFDASKDEKKRNGTYKNDVYGKSDHLQTNNITIKYWKRIA